MNIDEAIEFLRANRFTTDTHGRVEVESMNMVLDEVERLRGIEARAKAASVAGVDPIVRDAALHILNYGT